MTNRVSKILLDTNICLDLLVNRNISVYQKKQLFSLFLKNKIEVYIPVCSIDTIYYILNSSMKIDADKSRELITTLLKYTNTLQLNEKEVFKALKSDFNDFEDALIYYAAEDKGIDIILTFNKKDFKGSSLDILTPLEFINRFD